MKRCEGEHLQSENFSYDNKKKRWAFKNKKHLFFQRCPLVCPLELAALRWLLAHSCFSCFWTSKQGPCEDPAPGSGAGASRKRSSHRAPEGAVFSRRAGRRLQPTASGQRSSPKGCCCLLHSGKNHKLKNANNRSRGVTVLAPVSMSC